MLIPSSVFQGKNPFLFLHFFPPSNEASPSCRLHSSAPGNSHSALTWLIKDDTKLLSNITLVSPTRLIAAGEAVAAAETGHFLQLQSHERSWKFLGSVSKDGTVEQRDGCHSGTGITQGQDLDGAWKTKQRAEERGRQAVLGLRKNRVFVSVKDLTSSHRAISSKFSSRTPA